MGVFNNLFAKSEYQEVYLPYVVDRSNADENRKLGIVSIEAYGQIDGQIKYCNACFEITGFSDNTYKEIMSSLEASERKNILVQLEYKKDKLKDFAIDVDYLAKVAECEKIRLLNRICWGLNDESSDKLSR